MKIKRYLLSTFCLCLFTACDSDDNLLCYGTHTEIEGDVTTFGAVGDGKTDCSKAINSAIASLPSEGGVVVIPEGDFVLDAPIVINKHNVTFKGLNPGMRSNIDVNGMSWWSVITTVRPRSFASALSAEAAIPLSQVMIVSIPASSACSIR